MVSLFFFERRGDSRGGGKRGVGGAVNGAGKVEGREGRMVGLLVNAQARISQVGPR